MSTIVAPDFEEREGVAQRRGSADRAVEIKSVALRLFAERDFTSVTIKDIARSCNINTALIYYYFENKEDLFRAAIEHAIVQALERYQAMHGKHDDPVAAISDWFDTNAELLGPLGRLIKIMLDYSASPPSFPSVDLLIKQFYETECGILAGNIRRGVADGLFRPVDAERVALFVSTHLDGLVYASMIRCELEFAEMISDLKLWLWDHLGYRERAADASPASS